VVLFAALQLQAHQCTNTLTMMVDSKNQPAFRVPRGYATQLLHGLCCVLTPWSFDNDLEQLVPMPVHDTTAARLRACDAFQRQRDAVTSTLRRSCIAVAESLLATGEVVSRATLASLFKPVFVTHDFGAGFAAFSSSISQVHSLLCAKCVVASQRCRPVLCSQPSAVALRTPAVAELDAVAAWWEMTDRIPLAHLLGASSSGSARASTPAGSGWQRVVTALSSRCPRLDGAKVAILPLVRGVFGSHCLAVAVSLLD
jgi:hypothetical protein